MNDPGTAERNRELIGYFDSAAPSYSAARPGDASALFDLAMRWKQRSFEEEGWCLMSLKRTVFILGAGVKYQDSSYAPASAK